MAGVHLIYIKTENHTLEDIYLKVKEFLNCRDINIIVKGQSRNSGYYGDYYLIEFFGLKISIVDNFWANDENNIPFNVIEYYSYVIDITDRLQEINKEDIYVISNRFKVLLEKNGFNVYLPEKQPSDYW